MAKNWDKIKNQSAMDTLRNRDVYETQQLDRTKLGKKQSFASRHILAFSIGALVALFIWVLWSFVDVTQLNNQSAEDVNMAVVVTQPAPSEPRNFSDVTWANMLLVEDDTYSKYGYTYADKKTGVKYTQAEYEIWLDVHRRINAGECPELLVTYNKDGTRTYVEREPIAPPGDEPREWTNAEKLNFISYGIVNDTRYSDLGYLYRERYTNTLLTQAEFDTIAPYFNEDYVKSLIEQGLVTRERKDTSAENGTPITIWFYKDVDSNEVVPIIPTENAGDRYTVPIALSTVEYANLKLVYDDSAINLGYSYRDERTGLFYTVVEYEKAKAVFNDALYGNNGVILWIDVADDFSYVFSEKPPAYASSEPRQRVKNYFEPMLMKMNLVRNDKFWGDYGYFYYDSYTRVFYSEAEYQLWLDVQNRVANGTLHIPQKTQSEIRNSIGVNNVSETIRTHLDPLPITYSYGDGFMHVSFLKAVISGAAGFLVYSLLRSLLKRNLDAQNLMNDTSDINQYENDQHIALPEEVQRKFDWFPDVGAHCPVQVSSMISHMMITNKGLNKIKLARRAEKDIVDEDGDVIYYKGEMLLDDNGDPITDMVPLIDTSFGDALYEASGAPKEVRKMYDTTKIPYNPDGKDRTKQCGTHKTVADAINKTWTFPDYEPQRPAGAYIVDTEPVNTMVLAITRAGKGQTVIEPTIDMWTREMRPNNMVINDPKGELLVKNYVRGTVRGFQIIQFNLINAMKTDIYNRAA